MRMIIVERRRRMPAKRKRQKMRTSIKSIVDWGSEDKDGYKRTDK